MSNHHHPNILAMKYISTHNNNNCTSTFNSSFDWKGNYHSNRFDKLIWTPTVSSTDTTQPRWSDAKKCKKCPPLKSPTRPNSSLWKDFSSSCGKHMFTLWISKHCQSFHLGFPCLNCVVTRVVFFWQWPIRLLIQSLLGWLRFSKHQRFGLLSSCWITRSLNFSQNNPIFWNMSKVLTLWLTTLYFQHYAFQLPDFQ